MSDDVQREPKGVSLFWLAYGQIASLLGAFSLLVFLQHFADIGLKGIVAQAVDGWVQYVRPVVGAPMQWVVDLLPQARRIEVPPVAKDYVAVGIVNLLSFVRMSRIYGDRIAPTNRDGVIALFFFVALWPMVIGLTIATALDFLVGRRDPSQYRLLLWVAPLLYLGLILAANAWLA